MTTEERKQQIRERLSRATYLSWYREDAEWLLEQLSAQERIIAERDQLIENNKAMAESNLNVADERDRFRDALFRIRRDAPVYDGLPDPRGYQMFCVRVKQAADTALAGTVPAEKPDNPCGDALDRLWKEIIVARRPNYGDWEYPMQAYRHILAEFKEAVAERDRLAESMQYIHDNDLIDRGRLNAILAKEKALTGTPKKSAAQLQSYFCSVRKDPVTGKQSVTFDGVTWHEMIPVTNVSMETPAEQPKPANSMELAMRNLEEAIERAQADGVEINQIERLVLRIYRRRERVRM